MVKLALGNQRSIEYILDKCTQAINGLYRARCNADDKDLVFLVLKFGGPSLLNILHQAKCFPSTSVAYQMNKECPPIKISVHMSVIEWCTAYIHKDLSLSPKNFSLSIKCYETCVNGKIKYDPRINKPVELCYQHCNEVGKNFNLFEDADLIQQKLASDDVHVPKECLVAGVASLTYSDPFNVILIWPSCSKNDFSGMVFLYSKISHSLMEKNGAPPLNFCTDGVGTRRQAINSLRIFSLNLASPLGELIAMLPLVDLLVSKFNETSNFDVKYLVKKVGPTLLNALCKFRE